MKIGIIGTGAYGLALADVLDYNKCDITLWTKFEKECEMLINTNKHERVLPDVLLPKSHKYTTDIKEVILDKEIIIFAIPAEFIKDTIELCKELFTKAQIIILATKGIDCESGNYLHDIINDNIKECRLVLISGPSFAIDIISKKPIGLTVASKDKEALLKAKKAFNNNYFCLRTSDDIVGSAICGAVKNVIAIAAGILDGLGANESTKAMFITEAMNDVRRLIDQSNGNERTILSFAGIGDLILTATSPKSRNYSFGQILSLNDKMKKEDYINNTTVEGLYTLNALHKKIEKENIHMPIINLIYEIVYLDKNPECLYKFLIEKNNF